MCQHLHIKHFKLQYKIYYFKLAFEASGVTKKKQIGNSYFDIVDIQRLKFETHNYS
jgi:hypothetical protein